VDSDDEDLKPSIQELERVSRKRSRSGTPLEDSDRGSKFLRASVDPLSRSESASYPPSTGVNTPDNNDENGVAGSAVDDPLVFGEWIVEPYVGHF
jgi:hypothetical protein